MHIRCGRVLLLLTLSVLGACSGCILGMAAYKPARHEYLLKRDAKSITAWALNQKEYEKISDAFGALAQIAAMERRDARDAVEGYVAIHSKLRSGWPGFTSGDPDETDDKRRRYWEDLVKSSYSVGFEPNRYVSEIYRRIEPPVTAVEEHKAWAHDPTSFGSERLNQNHTDALD